MQLLKALLTEVSQQSHIDVIRDEMYQLRTTLVDVIQNAIQSAEDNTPLKEINMRIKGRVAKWFSEHYLRHVEPAVRGLGIPGINNYLKDIIVLSDRDLRAELELSGSHNFMIMMERLPVILRRVGSRTADLLADQIAQYHTEFVRDVASVRRTAEKNKNQKAPKAPSVPSARGTQSAQVEDIANSVLTKLPKQIAGDIRNAIARSPNKLQALQQELVNRGIKL